MLPRRSHGEIGLSAAVAFAAFVASTHLALFERVFEFVRKHQMWRELDIGLALVVCAGAWLYFLSLRRNRQLAYEMQRREAAEERAHASARHDSLTGLPNRLFFTEAVTEALAEPNSSVRHAVLFIDLDRFKPVNDTFGHDIGDAVLITVARRLRAALPEAKQIARLGGDEFGILLAGSGCQGISVDGAVERTRRTLQRPIAAGSTEVKIGVTIGAALATEHQDSAEGLIRAADLAMYDGKRQQPVQEPRAA